MWRKTEIYSVPGFVRGESPRLITGGVPPIVKHLSISAAIITAFHILPPVPVVAAATHTVTNAPISSAFDAKIWPLFLDLGKPLAKTMIALGVYKMIRNDVDKGWKMAYRAGLGLVALYLVDGAIHILIGVGKDLQSA